MELVGNMYALLDEFSPLLVQAELAAVHAAKRVAGDEAVRQLQSDLSFRDQELERVSRELEQTRAALRAGHAQRAPCVGGQTPRPNANRAAALAGTSSISPAGATADIGPRGSFATVAATDSADLLSSPAPDEAHASRLQQISRPGTPRIGSAACAHIPRVQPLLGLQQLQSPHLNDTGFRAGCAPFAQDSPPLCGGGKVAPKTPALASSVGRPARLSRGSTMAELPPPALLTRPAWRSSTKDARNAESTCAQAHLVSEALGAGENTVELAPGNHAVHTIPRQLGCALCIANDGSDGTIGCRTPPLPLKRRQETPPPSQRCDRGALLPHGNREIDGLPGQVEATDIFQGEGDQVSIHNSTATGGCLMASPQHRRKRFRPNESEDDLGVPIYPPVTPLMSHSEALRCARASRPPLLLPILMQPRGPLQRLLLLCSAADAADTSLSHLAATSQRRAFSPSAHLFEVVAQLTIGDEHAPMLLHALQPFLEQALLRRKPLMPRPTSNAMTATGQSVLPAKCVSAHRACGSNKANCLAYTVLAAAADVVAVLFGISHDCRAAALQVVALGQVGAGTAGCSRLSQCDGHLEVPCGTARRVAGSDHSREAALEIPKLGDTHCGQNACRVDSQTGCAGLPCDSVSHHAHAPVEALPRRSANANGPQTISTLIGIVEEEVQWQAHYTSLKRGAERNRGGGASATTRESTTAQADRSPHSAIVLLHAVRALSLLLWAEPEAALRPLLPTFRRWICGPISSHFSGSPDLLDPCQGNGVPMRGNCASSVFLSLISDPTPLLVQLATIYLLQSVLRSHEAFLTLVQPPRDARSTRATCIARLAALLSAAQQSRRRFAHGLGSHQWCSTQPHAGHAGGAVLPPDIPRSETLYGLTLRSECAWCRGASWAEIKDEVGRVGEPPEGCVAMELGGNNASHIDGHVDPQEHMSYAVLRLFSRIAVLHPNAASQLLEPTLNLALPVRLVSLLQARAHDLLLGSKAGKLELAAIEDSILLLLELARCVHVWTKVSDWGSSPRITKSLLAAQKFYASRLRITSHMGSSIAVN